MNAVEIRRYPEVAADHLPTQLPLIIRQVLSRRGITDAAALQLGAEGLPAVQLLKGAEQAAERLAKAIEHHQHICICGDFDADGATSTALMMSALTAFGASQLSYIVPNRFSDGYGLSEPVVAQAIERGADVIVTVDNGISCHQGIAAANAAQIDVIVTDHHLPGEQLPAAFAIVNPNQPDCSFPSKAIAGVGVAFYLLLALRQQFRQRQKATPKLADWLDLVAVGTVADVVTLDGVNRILVEQGLRRIRAGHCRPGIRALIEIAGRDPEQLRATDLGFTIGPRINAAGRLDDMSLGIECLLTDDPSKARQLALELDQLNRDRRQIEGEMREQAAQYLAQYQITDGGELPPLIVLHEANWHQGVIGIVAGRVKEQVQRPVIAFAKAEDGWLKGSARSIPGLHIRDLLERVHSLYPGLIERFGGHAMAAGLTLAEAELPRFQEAVVELAEQWLQPEQLQAVIWSDGELDASCFSVPFVQQLESVGPFGQGFSEPIFDAEFELVNQRLVGEKHLKLVLATKDRIHIDAIAFNIDVTQWPDASVKRIHGAYKVQLNHFRGRTSVQLQLEHFFALR